MKTGMVFVVVGVIFVLCGPVLALEVLEAGRVVETYISYTCLGKPGPSGMVFDGYGNLYLSHWGDYNSVEGVIYCVNPYKQVVRFVDGLGTPRRMVWAGGTSYGEYLYVADCTGKEIVRVGLDGTVATVCRVSALPHSLVLDKTGTYGGRLFTATRGADRIYSISESGEVKRFSSFPGPIPGGHVDLTFDPGTNFGGLMYAALECDQLSTRVIGGVYCKIQRVCLEVSFS
ncbi:MAG: SMP-30/gluconolactonase/LRE family protein [Planctomycetota bacterium]|jgi:sugar lactone lactonase YvrE